MKKALVLATALSMATVAASADWNLTPDPGLIAWTSTTSEGIAVGVVFGSRSEACDTAGITIFGRDDVRDLTLIVDDLMWDGNAVSVLEGISGVQLSAAHLRALKNGQSAMLVTDHGTIAFSLKRSARAINDAWRNCLKQAERESVNSVVGVPMVPQAIGPSMDNPKTIEYRF